MADEMTDIAVRLEKTHSLCLSNEKRIDNLEEEIKTLHETQIALVKIANSVENMGKAIEEINGKIDGISGKQDAFTEKINTLENQPAQKTHKWIGDTAEKISWIIIGGFVVWFLGHLFPNVPW